MKIRPLYHTRISWRLIPVLFFGFIIPHAALAAAPAPQGQGDFASQMDERMPELLARYRVPGAVAAYIENGAVAWTHAYGVADLRTGQAMQPDMIFNFGSCGKVLTAWGVMRLVEQGKIELDAPANRYLKRWQLQSDQFDPNGVTIRRLLSHTAGLNIHGYNDYGPRRALPSLAQVLNGDNQGIGRVTIEWQPGTHYAYSGGGFVILQMIIEDVSGESFDTFMQREVTGPLGMDSLHWEWSQDLIGRAAVPYGPQNEPVGYRQLASHAVGSEVGTAADFARFVAAAAPGKDGEPAGRGVLLPETIRQMAEIQSGTDGTQGLGYGVVSLGGDTLLMHFGSNPGWNAFFILDVPRSEGLVFVNNSSNGFELNTAVENLWTSSVLNKSVNVYNPAPRSLTAARLLFLGVAAVLSVPWLVAAAGFIVQLRRGRRRFTGFHTQRLWFAAPWAALVLFWWYWMFSPFKLFFPPSFPDIWPLPEAGLVMGVLLAWLVFSFIAAFSLRVNRPPRET